MGKVKALIINILQTVLPGIWFQKIWSYYIRFNSNYETDREAYTLSNKAGKEKYCIFRFDAPSYGIMAVAKVSLLLCEWAKKNKRIPIIDFEWRDVYKNNLLGEDNIWEYVFKLPVSVKKAAEGRKVFVGAINGEYADASIKKKVINSGVSSHIRIEKDNWRAYYKNLNFYCNKWWILKEDVKEKFENTFSELFTSEMKIMGVALREEFALIGDVKSKEIDYSILRQHPAQPSVDDMVKIIKEYKQKWGCTHIFVTTYIEDSIVKLEREFGKQLLYIKRRRVPYEKWKPSVLECSSKTAKDVVEAALWTREHQEVNTWDEGTVVEYVEEIWGLSLCDCLLAGKSGGTLAACIWNGGKYDELEILQDTNKSIYY